ncbi:SDR family NAD(P)-dependent oxidoreductase [Phenylobacterium sp. LjRoot225]|uniref:SDR family NAD(P)-dependent oxidoreductase n=1 Tax=Phenylobacterium sp. LjRoot225 TaxID=3342285 RepID=UPI003ED0AAF8
MTFQERYGPWAVVAGASEGVGRSFARAIAAKGVHCILLANGGPLEEAAVEIEADYRVECRTAHIDLSRPETFAEIVAAVGPRDIGLYVANAGADPYGARFHDRPASDWLGLIGTNITTTVQSCHHFGGRMRTRRRGGLLIVNSGACYGGCGSLAIYTAAKAFQLNLSESLWSELRPHGVDVLTLVLGQTDTPAYHRLQAKKGMPSSPNLASPDAVAAVGLERLPHGPVCNWGLADDDAGYLPASAAERRERVVAIEAALERVFGKAEPA